LLEPAAVALALLAAGFLDQDAAHGLGRGSEEVAAAVPVRLGPPRLPPRAPPQPPGRPLGPRPRPGGLPRPLLRELLRRQPPQLVVHERQQLLGGVLIALLDRGQDARDVTHRRHSGLEDAVRCPPF